MSASASTPSAMGTAAQPAARATIDSSTAWRKRSRPAAVDDVAVDLEAVGPGSRRACGSRRPRCRGR